MKPTASDSHGAVSVWKGKNRDPFFNWGKQHKHIRYTTPHRPYMMGFPVNRWYVGKQNVCSFAISWYSRKGNQWHWEVVTGVIKSGWSQKWEGSNASGDQPHSSIWFHRNMKLMLCSSGLCQCNDKRESKKKQQSHPRDSLYRAVTAALRPQQISRLCQDRRPCGTLLAPTHTSHSDSRTQIYAGCLLNGCQCCSQFCERHLACIRSLSGSQWARCPQGMNIFESCHIRQCLKLDGWLKEKGWVSKLNNLNIWGTLFVLFTIHSKPPVCKPDIYRSLCQPHEYTVQGRLCTAPAWTKHTDTWPNKDSESGLKQQHLPGVVSQGVREVVTRTAED